MGRDSRRRYTGDAAPRALGPRDVRVRPRWPAAAAALLAMACSQNIWADGSASAGKGRFGLCESCHGLRAEGNQALGAPGLTGLQTWYVARQIENFAAGVRGGSPDDTLGRQMQPMARTLNQPEAIPDVLAHLATLPIARPAVTVQGDASRGRNLYAACSACHGQAGEGSEALRAPALRYSNDWYLLRQLENFRQGTRGASEGDTAGAQMRAVAATLPDEQSMRDVIAYVATLSRQQ